VVRRTEPPLHGSIRTMDESSGKVCRSHAKFDVLSQLPPPSQMVLRGKTRGTIVDRRGFPGTTRPGLFVAEI
jgi:hypothetical protein